MIEQATPFSYDSYTEGQYMAVLSYLIRDDSGRAPSGRDELAEWVLEQVTWKTQLEAAEALLRRIAQWDMLDTAEDGPYWRNEIVSLLGKEGE